MHQYRFHADTLVVLLIQNMGGDSLVLTQKIVGSGLVRLVVQVAFLFLIRIKVSILSAANLTWAYKDGTVTVDT